MEGFRVLLETNIKFKWYLAVGSLDQYAGDMVEKWQLHWFKGTAKYSKHLEIFPNHLDVKESHLTVDLDRWTSRRCLCPRNQ